MTTHDQKKSALEWFDSLPLRYEGYEDIIETIRSLLKERAEEQKMVNVPYEDGTPSRDWVVDEQTSKRSIPVSEISDEDIEAIRNAKVPEEYEHLNGEIEMTDAQKAFDIICDRLDGYQTAKDMVRLALQNAKKVELLEAEVAYNRKYFCLGEKEQHIKTLVQALRQCSETIRINLVKASVKDEILLLAAFNNAQQALQAFREG